MSISYTYVGVRHFIDPDFFLAIMPNYLTFHLEFVYLSGIAEVVLGLMLLSKKTRKTGAIGIIILLILIKITLYLKILIYQYLHQEQHQDPILRSYFLSL